MLEKRTRQTSAHVDLQGGVTHVHEVTEVLENGVILGAVAHRQYQSRVEEEAQPWMLPPHGGWSLGAIATHAEARWISLEDENIEKPSASSTSWHELAPLDPATRVIELLRRLVRDVTLPLVDADEVPEADVVPLYPQWVAWMKVTADEVYAYAGQLFEVVQTHVTQPDWEPNNVPSLWRVHREPSVGTPEWEPGIAVAVGELFTYEGVTYVVIQAHTTQVGWEPPGVPALWGVHEGVT